MSRNEWKEINENIIDLIRAYDKKTIPLVVGFDWAYDLNFLHYDPVNAEGIAYVTHPYLMKRSRPWEAKWEENFGFAADRHPRMIESWDTYKLTGCGAFFKEALHGKVGN